MLNHVSKDVPKYCQGLSLNRTVRIYLLVPICHCISPVEILSKQPGDSKNDMKKRRLSAELNWIKRLQTPYPLGLNDQIYQQGNISSVRSNINVFSLKPDVRRKRRSHGVRRNGLSRRKQRLNRSLDDLLRIAKNNGRHELLHALSSIPVSRLKPNPG